MNANEEKVTYPWVTFKIHGEYYCISSQYVAQMITQISLTPTPNAPPYLTGLLNLRGSVYPVVDLRMLFGMKPLKIEVLSFSTMKEKHLSWIANLKKAAIEHSEFTGIRDPHKCSFGEWYYSYSTDNNAINHILNRIEEPHIKMHQQADILFNCIRLGDIDAAKVAFTCAEQLCNNIIIPLLDDLIDTYTSLNKGMIILLEKEDNKLGLLVDLVTSIDDFTINEEYNQPLKLASNNYLENILLSENSTIFLELNINQLMKIGEEFK